MLLAKRAPNVETNVSQMAGRESTDTTNGSALHIGHHKSPANGLERAKLAGRVCGINPRCIGQSNAAAQTVFPVVAPAA